MTQNKKTNRTLTGYASLNPIVRVWKIRISLKRTHRSQQKVMKLTGTNLRMTSNKMPLSEIRMPRLTTEQRLRALGMLESGSGQFTVARHCGVQQSTIYGLWNRFHLHGTVNDGPRSGRPRITTRDQDRYIRIQHLRDRFRTATLTAVASVGLHNRPVSWWTIRRRLHEGGLQAHRPFRGPTLSQEIRQNRLPWARWSFQRWRAWNCIGLLSLELPIFRMNRGECSQGILTPAMTLCASCRRSGMQLLNRPSET